MNASRRDEDKESSKGHWVKDKRKVLQPHDLFKKSGGKKGEKRSENCLKDVFDPWNWKAGIFSSDNDNPESLNQISQQE